MASDRVQIVFITDGATAAAFDAAHDRLGYAGLCERIERLLLTEIEPAPRLHAWRKHGNRRDT